MSELKLQKRVVLPVTDLKRDPANPNEMSKQELDGLRESLRRWGYLDPIVIDQDNVIANGEHRLEVLIEAGYTKVECVQIELKSDEERRLVRQTLNKLHGQHDKAKDADEMKLLYDAGKLPDLSKLLGQNEETLLRTIERSYNLGIMHIDDIPELPKGEPKVKRGEVWKLGEHRLICGNSTEKTDIETLFAGQRAKFCFTSPPYSDQRSYDMKGIDLDPSHLAPFLEAPCDLFAVNLGIKRSGGEVIPYWNTYIDFARSKGLAFLSWNIWVRETGGGVGHMTAMFPIEHEWIFVFGQKQKLNKTIPSKHGGERSSGTNRQKSGKMTAVTPYTTGLYKALGTVIRTDVYRAQEGNIHPAMFPVELPKQYILACTQEAEIVYDPFLGSGTTLIAGETTRRRCYGMEIDPRYCDVIIARWEKLTGQKATLEA